MYTISQVSISMESVSLDGEEPLRVVLDFADLDVIGGAVSVIKDLPFDLVFGDSVLAGGLEPATVLFLERFLFTSDGKY
jgi:hypothetical protein